MVSFTLIIKGIPNDVPRFEALWEWDVGLPSESRRTIWGNLPENEVTFSNVPDVGKLYIAHYRADGTGVPQSTTSPGFPGTAQVKDGATYEVVYNQSGWSQVKLSIFPFILVGAFFGLVAWFRRKR